MPSPSLPHPAALPSLPPSALNAVLDTLFEPSGHLHDLASPLFEEHFSSYPDLIDAVKSRLAALADSAAQPGNDDNARVLYDILGSHPRLGASRSNNSHLSESSRLEQANLAAPDNGDSEADQLRRLNAEYEEKFPGLRYVVFVNGRGRDVIMQNMRERIQRGDVNLEIQETIQVSFPSEHSPVHTPYTPFRNFHV
ncbi:hypothetical protein FQN49_002652 [Arthroderma sp. PD_2]|nr:hypothetical protein FQN49_002652 [Arthroderma sp. PD_2]